MAACRSCNAPVFWAYTEQGKSMPIDQKPDPENGNVYTDENGIAHVEPDPAVRDRLAKRGVRFHTSHFATCPDAASHRK